MPGQSYGGLFAIIDDPRPFLLPYPILSGPRGRVPHWLAPPLSSG